MDMIMNKTFDEERALYGVWDITVKECSFDGSSDWESVFKESGQVTVDHCFFSLRYPFWHDNGLVIRNSEMTELCRRLKLVNCEMEDADLCFEKSEVEATITTPVISIKNSLSGYICVPCGEEIIQDDVKLRGEIVIQKKCCCA